MIAKYVKSQKNSIVISGFPVQKVENEIKSDQFLRHSLLFEFI